MATAAGGDGAACNEVGGGGAGGKFRKRPFRRPHTTPYDRPPTAIRNPSRNGTGWGGGSWLSKLIVDPASKLVSTGAQMFFSSVLRKRLPPPLLPPPPEKWIPANVLGADRKICAPAALNGESYA